MTETASSSVPDAGSLIQELPLLSATPSAWAELAARELPTFLADHAVCEQQAALFGLSLVGHYPEDLELVEKMTALAAEEVSHLRRVVALCRRRGFPLAKKRRNPWVQGLRQHIVTQPASILKVDRLLLGALIEARSCERFTALLRVVEHSDAELSRLLHDLGPAEMRHWRMFFALAQRELDAEPLTERWQGWLELEDRLSQDGSIQPTVHG